MGVVLDFVDKALRKKVQGLLDQADAKMSEYTLYRMVHEGAPFGSAERKTGLAIYSQYQDLCSEAVELAKGVKGPYKFVSKNVALSRSGDAFTNSNGGMTINMTGMTTVMTKGPDYPIK